MFTNRQIWRYKQIINDRWIPKQIHRITVNAFNITLNEITFLIIIIHVSYLLYYQCIKSIFTFRLLGASCPSFEACVKLYTFLCASLFWKFLRFDFRLLKVFEFWYIGPPSQFWESCASGFVLRDILKRFAVIKQYAQILFRFPSLQEFWESIQNIYWISNLKLCLKIARIASL